VSFCRQYIGRSILRQRRWRSRSYAVVIFVVWKTGKILQSPVYIVLSMVSPPLSLLCLSRCRPFTTAVKIAVRLLRSFRNMKADASRGSTYVSVLSWRGRGGEMGISFRRVLVYTSFIKWWDDSSRRQLHVPNVRTPPTVKFISRETR